MKSMKYTALFIWLSGCLFFCLPTFAQSNNLYSAGYASAFIGGLYDGYFPYRQLKTHGDFGLGAIDKMDGELTMLNGKIYQTQFTGKTLVLNDEDKTPYAVVCFFHAAKVIHLNSILDKASLYRYLDSLLADQNGMYAIHIKGNFNYVKTRAFPPVANKPYLPLADMLGKQHFFEFNSIKGDLVGYRLPSFMEGAHISGYHFHFLSDKKDAGGHIIDLKTNDIVIEIDKLDNYTVALPQNDDFSHFDFKKDRKEEIKSVENGKKQ
jgi:acetolactate decarboxylase